MEEDQNQQGVFRQRRNFLLASAISAAFLFLEIEFSEIQVFGIKFLVHNKDNILWILFAWWCYMLWRYYQYHRIIRDNSISEHYNGVIFRIVNPIVERAAKKAYPEAPATPGANYFELARISPLRFRFKGKLYFPGKDGNHLEPKEAPFEISALWLVVAHFIAFLSTLFSNHRVSDYLLPYAIAALLLVAFLVKLPVTA